MDFVYRKGLMGPEQIKAATELVNVKTVWECLPGFEWQWGLTEAMCGAFIVWSDLGSSIVMPVLHRTKNVY